MNSQEAYESATQEQRDYIDKLMATIDARMAARQESRDRRKLDLPYQASGLPDRRVADRRKTPREE